MKADPIKVMFREEINQAMTEIKEMLAGAELVDG